MKKATRKNHQPELLNTAKEGSDKNYHIFGEPTVSPVTINVHCCKML